MYIFYLDESGEREYESNSQYFSLCALGVPVHQWQSIDAQLNQLKMECFGRSDVEIKSSWLRRAREREKHYIKPYEVSPESLQQLTEQIYQLLLEPEVVIIACVVDKHALQRQPSAPKSALIPAYRALLQQIEVFLHRQDAYGMVVFDKINESQFKKYGYETELAAEHRLWRQLTAQKHSPVHIVEGVLFLPSHEHNFIQLADLCAYNIYRQFVDYGGEWEVGFTSKYPYFALIESKLACDANGEYRGYGLVRYPEKI